MLAKWTTFSHNFKDMTKETAPEMAPNIQQLATTIGKRLGLDSESSEIATYWATDWYNYLSDTGVANWGGQKK